MLRPDHGGSLCLCPGIQTGGKDRAETQIVCVIGCCINDSLRLLVCTVYSLIGLCIRLLHDFRFFYHFLYLFLGIFGR